MSDSSNTDSSDDTSASNDSQPNNEYEQINLTDKQEEAKSDCGESREKDQDNTKELQRGKLEGCEYSTRSDGSVICKLCGEILQSRTHWYRHKYKLHVPANMHPAPLYQCEQCSVFFKSRKGYLGHISSRHPTSDTNASLCNTQTESTNEPQQHSQQQLQQHPIQQQQHVTEELDSEIPISQSSLPMYQPLTTKPTTSKPPEQSKILRSNRSTPAVGTPISDLDLEEKRMREEKLVTDIIDRVRRECEAQGSAGPARRGYSRRPTTAAAMHT